jgi:predicted dehydrogenase
MGATVTEGPMRLAIVGSAWRAEFFRRVAGLLPEHFTLVGAAVRRPEVAARVRSAWSVPAYLSPEELARQQRPELVVVAVPWAATPDVVRTLVHAGCAVLCETPPAPDLGGLRALWADVGRTRRIQVAEQYPLMPGHAARKALVDRGLIGTPTSVHVSSTHGYHAVSIMRHLLGVRPAAATVTGSRFVAPLVDPLTRDAWTDDSDPKPAGTTLATIDFGDGRSGLYDFTDNQWHNQLRHRRIVIRGSHGEIADDNVVRLAAERTILRSPLVRSQLGYDLNLDGYDTEHLSFEGAVVWRNPFLGLRLMDEEIAIASLMTASAAWARDEGPEPYPLAEACQDHLLSLAIEQACDAGAPIRTEAEPWA